MKRDQIIRAYLINSSDETPKRSRQWLPFWKSQGVIDDGNDVSTIYDMGSSKQSKGNRLKSMGLKILSLTSLLLIVAANAQALEVKSTKVELEPASIDQVIRLVNKKDQNGSIMKTQVVVTDMGLSTDVSPRHRVFLTFASFAEMGNITANFLVTENALEFFSAKRISGGIYEVKVRELIYKEDLEGLYDVTYKIDAKKMYSAEKKLRKSCGGDFCDEALETSITIESIATKSVRH